MNEEQYIKREDAVIAYHFVNDNWTLGYDLDTQPVHVGMVLSMPDADIKMCKRGYHASLHALDALSYRRSGALCIVKVWGRVIFGNDKLVASNREVVAMLDVERTLHEFAIWCAEQALAHIENPDPRSLEALVVKRRFLDGDATADELTTARAAASAAASTAAWAAASTAAWEAASTAAWAAARAAAWEAARAAAWAAARAAAWAAARAAAWEAARAAAWEAASAAARDAAWDAQKVKLDEMIAAAQDGGGEA